MEEPKKKSKSRYIAAAVGAVVVIAVSVFIISSNSNHIQATTSTAPPADTVGTGVGNIAPDFTLVDPQKGEITKQTFAGRPLVIYVMATWCSSCYIGVDNLASYYDQSEKNFNVLLVSADGTDTSSKLAQFQQVYGRPGWYIASGVPDMVNTYHVTLLDTKYIVDKDGIIKWKGSDILDANALGNVMKQAVGA